MPSEAHEEIARQIRALAAQGRYHGPAVELVKLFGLEFTSDAVSEVEAALSHEGLASQPPLRAEKPKAHVRVVIIGGSSANSSVQAEPVKPGETLRVRI
jgi:hypothetical protein